MHPSPRGHRDSQSFLLFSQRLCTGDYHALSEVKRLDVSAWNSDRMLT
jgi:hypothetical protein